MRDARVYPSGVWNGRCYAANLRDATDAAGTGNELMHRSWDRRHRQWLQMANDLPDLDYTGCRVLKYNEQSLGRHFSVIPANWIATLRAHQRYSIRYSSKRRKRCGLDRLRNTAGKHRLKTMMPMNTECINGISCRFSTRTCHCRYLHHAYRRSTHFQSAIRFCTVYLKVAIVLT